MRKTKQVILTIMGTALAATSLSGCNPPAPVPVDQGGTFANMAECLAKYDQPTCQTAQKLAYQQHWQNAPHYTTLGQCIDAYGPGACQPGSYYGGGSNFFVPMMIGYTLGSMNSRPVPLYYGPGAWRIHTPGYVAPIYGSAVGYTGRPIGTMPYARSSYSAAPHDGASTFKAGLNSGTAMGTGTVTQRGGFGSTFKPANSFTASYTARNPGSFGTARPTVSSGSSFGGGKSTSTFGGSSVSARGGFGGSSGGSFGG